MPDRIFDIFFGLNIDEQKARKSAAAIEEMDKRIEHLERSVSNLNQVEGALNDINSRIAATGAVVFAPLVLSATRYVEATGKAEESSRRWLSAQERLNKTTIDVGRQATAALVPYLEALADIGDMIANLDPGIIKAGVNAGGALVLTGAVGLLSANVIKFVSATADMTAAMIKIAAAGGLQGGLAKAGIYGSAIGVGTALGVGAVNLIGSATGDERLKDYGFDDLFETLKQILFIAGTLFLDFETEIAKSFLQFKAAFDNGTIETENAILDFTAKILEGGRGLLEKLGLSDSGEPTEDEGGNFVSDAVGLLKSFASGTGAGIAQTAGVYDEFSEITNALGDVDGTLASIAEKQAQNAERQKDVEEELASDIERVGENADDLKLKWADLLGLMDDSTDEMIQKFDTELLDKFDQFQDGLIEAEETFYDARAKQLEDFDEETAKLEDDFNRQRMEQTEDFERNRAQQESDFNDKRLEQQQEFEKSQKKNTAEFERQQIAERATFEENQTKLVLESEKSRLDALEDFNRQRERAEQDHRDRLRGAAARLDATAVLQELRSFDKEKTRAQEDFGRQQSEREQQTQERIAQERQEFDVLQRERTQQFNARQQDEENKFRERQSKELLQFEEQQRRADENFQRQLDRQQQYFDRAQSERENEFNERRREEHQNFIELQQERRNQFRQELNDLQSFQNAESATRQRHYEQLQRQLDAFLGGGRLPSRPGQKIATPFFNDQGGISSGGLAMLHAGEGVLRRDTTDALMRAVGSFNQQRIQNFINSRSVGDLNSNLNINGSNMSPTDVARIVERTMIGLLESV